MKYTSKLVIRLSLIILVTLFYGYYLDFLRPITLYLSVISMNLIGYNTIADLEMARFIIQTSEVYGVINLIPACIAVSAYYLLFLLVSFTKDLSLKKSLKIFFSGFLILLLANVLRIIFLTLVRIKFGKYWFDALHLGMWYFVSGIFVALTWVFLVKKFKIKEVPFYSDFKYLYKLTKKGRKS